ncbi:uridine kinase family protein [Lactococcus termiticola]|uniref:Uridine kinase n=1 Tax=Lactococcus termiticola TaxID=2169526 RepID=A0A2R5HCV1_9LACT|nr:phosphoribulokinase [Lactococcus termiticola]GBG95914.1 uridine kinase [Lactococcus termiticola]
MNEIFQKIEALLSVASKPTILTIEGGAASGKTSLADLLKSKYGAEVIHMDDFFLRPEQRTAERLSEVGGNIDYERFKEEVVNHLGTSFSYRPYDCVSEQLSEPRGLRQSKLIIVEGVYSMHPYFGNYSDLKIFLSCSSTEQKRRLMQRNARLYPRFVDEWLPMEASYFEKFKTKSMSDFILDASKKESL